MKNIHIIIYKLNRDYFKKISSQNTLNSISENNYFKNTWKQRYIDRNIKLKEKVPQFAKTRKLREWLFWRINMSKGIYLNEKNKTNKKSIDIINKIYKKKN